MSCCPALRLGVANRKAFPCAILLFGDIKTPSYLSLTLNCEPSTAMMQIYRQVQQYSSQNFTVALSTAGGNGPLLVAPVAPARI